LYIRVKLFSSRLFEACRIEESSTIFEGGGIVEAIIARICKCLRSPRIDSKESIAPAFVAWRAGTSNRVVVPTRQAGNRFLGSLKGLQIRALHTVYSNQESSCRQQAGEDSRAAEASTNVEGGRMVEAISTAEAIRIVKCRTHWMKPEHWNKAAKLLLEAIGRYYHISTRLQQIDELK
jgi:hypothetical protein